MAKTQGPGAKTDARQHRPCALSDLPVGSRGHVLSVGGDGELRRRLLEMGFCNGAAVEVIRRAPLGDPIEFRLRGYHLSLRSDQARHVQINPERSVPAERINATDSQTPTGKGG